jgi:hypothetical protein
MFAIAHRSYALTCRREKLKTENLKTEKRKVENLFSENCKNINTGLPRINTLVESGLSINVVIVSVAW